MGLQKLIILFSPILLLTACSKTPETSFNELLLITDPTETKLEERTDKWYSNQDFVRKKVLSTCLSHFVEKAEKIGGKYADEFNDNSFSKYKEYPDCENAREGEILKMSKNNTKIYSFEVKNLDEELSTEENKAEINALSESIASRLSSGEIEKNPTFLDEFSSKNEQSE